MTSTTPTLNASYPHWLCAVAEYASHVNDSRAMTWLARRLPAEGVSVGVRMALMPWPFPEEFGTLGTIPDACAGNRVGSLDGYASCGGDVDLAWLRRLEVTIRRSTCMLQAASRAGESIIAETLDAPDALPLVRDWLDALPETDPRMLDKLPRVTWEQGIEHARAYHARIARRAIRVASEEGTADPVQSVDGHRWLHLVTRDALDRESRAMGHCVGDGGYDDTTWLSGPDGEPSRPVDPMDAMVGIWSLRDGDGRSVITADVEMGCLGQIVQRFNDNPVPADVPHIAVLIGHLRTVMPNLGLPDWLVTDARDGSLQHVNAMPDGIHLADGRYMHPSDWTRIPEGIRVDGGTIIQYRGMAPAAFQGLHVIGRLAIYGTVALDGGLVVEGDLDLSGAEDKTVPEGAKITGRIVTEQAGFGEYEPFMRSYMGIMVEGMGLTYGQILFRPADDDRARVVGGIDLMPVRRRWQRHDRVPREQVTEAVTRGFAQVRCTLRQVTPVVTGIMTKNLVPGQEGLEIAQPVKARLARDLEQDRERQIVDAMRGVLTDCYGEPASLRHPERTGATTVTYTTPALYPAGLPRHLRDAPHYRQIEHRGGRRRLA